jgi:excisionase family DNA binding protein
MALKSFKQAAEQWGVSVYTARRLAAKGIVKTVRVGRRRLIAESEVARIEATGVSFSTQPSSALTSPRAASQSARAGKVLSPRRRRGE